MNRIISDILLVLIFVFGALNSYAQSQSLYVGGSATLSPPNPPANSAIYQTAWGTSGAHLKVEKTGTYSAKVTVTGYFTGIEQVQCDYYYRWYDNYGRQHTNKATTYYTITCKTVTATVSPTYLELRVNDGRALSYSYSPSNVYPSPILSFMSSNTNVAIVNSDGYVKGVGPGSATITLKNNAGPDATCTVKVLSVQPNSISLPDSKSMSVGDQVSLTATVYPSNASYTLAWSSSDNTVATVSQTGNVKAIKEGTAKITATVNGFPALSDFCVVTVKDNTPLTVSVSPTSGTYEKGTKIYLSTAHSGATIRYTTDGSTPTSKSNIYSSYLTLNESFTLKARAFNYLGEGGDVLISNYVLKRPVLSSLEDALDKAKLLANREYSEPYVVDFEPIVTYIGGASNYIAHEGAFSVIYKGDLGIHQGQIIKKGWITKLYNYNGLLELVPVEDTSIVGGEIVGAPKPLRIENVDDIKNALSAVVFIPEVEFLEDTPANRITFTGIIGSDSFTFYNNFALPSYPKDKYDVLATIGIYYGNFQVQPIELLSTTSITEIYLDETEEYYSLQGYRVLAPQKGAMYIRKKGAKYDKVIINQ